MKLPEVLERTQQSCAYVEQMWCMAVCQESHSLEEFLQYLSDDEVNEIFPNIDLEYWEAQRELDQMSTLPIQYGYLGFVLEIAVPHRSNFNLDKNDDYTRCSVHPGITRMIYAYAETTGDIVNELEKAGKKVLAENIAEYKKKLAISEK